MGWLLPKSLNGFLLLGLGFLAGPLLLAILHAAVQMRRLSDTSQQLVVDRVQSTRLTQDMYAQIALLERSARLYQVLGEPTVRASFREHDARLSEIIGTLRQRLRAADAPGQLRRLIDTQQRIESLVLPAPVPAGQAAELAQSFVQLGDLANGVAIMTDRQIDRAIGELGRGNFSNSIVINGPVDLERLGHQLEWLRNRLLELAQERNRFLRHLSHELKTPPAHIREGTELLMDGAVGELESGQREVTAILRDNGIKLQRLIENLLSFSAWQSNSTGLDVSEFRLRPVVKQVLENQQLTLVSQRVRLDVRVEDVTLLADRGKIRLILENLLSNAIKYSPRGGVIYLRAGASAEQLVLEVGDSGPGIPHEDRARIFDAFYTGRAPGGHVRGTGIGLSVVNEFVHVHHGTVEIADGEMPGAHFRIRMPLRVTPLEPVKKHADAA